MLDGLWRVRVMPPPQKLAGFGSEGRTSVDDAACDTALRFVCLSVSGETQRRTGFTADSGTHHALVCQTACQLVLMPLEASGVAIDARH